MPVLPIDSMPDPLPAAPKLEASADPKPNVAHESVPAPSKFVAPVLPADAAKKASTLPPPPFPKADDKK